MERNSNILFRRIENRFLGRLLGLCFLLPFTFLFFLAIRISPLGLAWLGDAFFHILVAKIVIEANYRSRVNRYFAVTTLVTGVYSLTVFWGFFVNHPLTRNMPMVHCIHSLLRFGYIWIPPLYCLFSFHFSGKKISRWQTIAICSLPVAFCLLNACGYFIVAYRVAGPVLIPEHSPVYTYLFSSSSIFFLAYGSYNIYQAFSRASGYKKKILSDFSGLYGRYPGWPTASIICYASISRWPRSVAPFRSSVLAAPPMR